MMLGKTVRITKKIQTTKGFILPGETYICMQYNDFYNTVEILDLEGYSHWIGKGFYTLEENQLTRILKSLYNKLIKKEEDD